MYNRRHRLERPLRRCPRPGNLVMFIMGAGGVEKGMLNKVA